MKYYVKEKKEINGKEVFTLFDSIDDILSAELIKGMKLKVNEIPVLSLKISVSNYIINTTERFIFLADSNSKSIEYVNFDGHIGFPLEIKTSINIKTEGFLSKFGMKMKTGEIVYINIPTGTPGFGFWNVTTKCELIGRKYL